MLEIYDLHKNVKDDIRKLYRRDKEGLTDAWKATTTYMHIGTWLSGPINMKLEGAVQWRQKNEAGTDHPACLIRILDSPERVDEILQDKNLEKYQFRIEEGINFSEAEKRFKQKQELYGLSNGVWPHPKWDSYSEFVETLKTTYGPDVTFNHLTPVNDEWVNAMIIRGIDVEKVSRGEIFIKMGDEIPQKPMWFKSWKELRTQPYKVRIL
ncbi:hypothetical protein HYW74_02405 [Candidatus Pacearchaeota archaeon]|nr:hypothetical protein [Candidatus Pacearchaeota archaeon]